MVQWNLGFRGGKKPPGGASHFLMQKEVNSAKEFPSGIPLIVWDLLRHSDICLRFNVINYFEILEL